MYVILLQSKNKKIKKTVFEFSKNESLKEIPINIKETYNNSNTQSWNPYIGDKNILFNNNGIISSTMFETTHRIEEWMKNQPLGIRKFEQHDRVRLKIAGKISKHKFFFY